jgi:hypothetical protein
MEFEELQSLWRGYDAKLNELARRNATLAARVSVNIANTRLGGFARVLSVEMLMYALVLFVLGMFAADHTRELPVFASAIVLDIFFAVSLAADIAQYVALRQIDYGETLLATTARLQRLRFMRARSQMWMLIVAPLLWVPMSMVALRAFVGLDALATFGPAYIALNSAFGLGVLLLGVMWAKQNGAQRPTGVLGRIADSLAGIAVRAAADELDQLRRYDEEIGP